MKQFTCCVYTSLSNNNLKSLYPLYPNQSDVTVYWLIVKGLKFQITILYSISIIGSYNISSISYLWVVKDIATVKQIFQKLQTI